MGKQWLTLFYWAPKSLRMVMTAAMKLKVACSFKEKLWLFATPWTAAHQAPPSMGFSRQEYWSGLPFPSPGDLPDPGIEPGSPAFQADTLTSEPPGKPMTNLDNILKSRDITLPTKVCIVKTMVFPVIVYRCESWTIKKPEPWRIDSFKLWCWRRLLRVPWTSRRAKAKENQPWIFTGGTDAKAKTLILRPSDVNSWLTVKDPDAGKGGNRRWDG